MAEISPEELGRLLEEMPAWRALASLPEQIRALADRVASLEREAVPEAAKWPCPVCGEALLSSRVLEESTHGRLGLQRHEAECPTCGHVDDRHLPKPPG